VRTRNLDNLIAGLAVVRDVEIATSGASPEAAALFERIVSTTIDDVPAPLAPRRRDDRSRRRRRRLVVAAAVGVAVIGGPALALRGHVVHLFARSEPAPPSVEQSFRIFDDRAPEKDRLGPARKVLEVTTPEGPVVIWAAPARGGGFCFGVGTETKGNASTCDRAAREDLAKLDPWPFFVGDRGQSFVAPFLIAGHTVERKAVSIRVRFNNGESLVAPVTWVSPPIDVGFFALWVPKRFWVDDGIHYDAVSIDENGNEVGPHAGMGLGVPNW
jgi:hypothetical protein